MEYVYLPLKSKNSIRIIELQPSQETLSPLRCFIRPLNLEEPDSTFEAVSYTWGTATANEILHIGNESVLKIRENLSAALHRFRLPTAARNLWVDAVCINQNDNDEKSNQIPLMADIYRSASAVLVWLGNFTAAEKAMNFANKSDLVRLRFSQGQGQHTDHTISQTLKDIMSPPWFNRLWIIQEAVSNSDVTLFCGYSQMPWPKFLQKIEQMRVKRVESETTTSLMLMRDLWASNTLQVVTKAEFQMLNLLHNFQHFGCADPRDRVFALACLARDVIISSIAKDGVVDIGNREANSKTLYICSDYSLSAKEVFSQFAVEAIRAGCLPWVLGQAEVHRSSHKSMMPSWVPDWAETSKKSSWGLADWDIKPLYPALRPYEDIVPVKACNTLDGGNKVMLELFAHVLDYSSEFPTVFWTSTAFPNTDDPVEVARWLKDATEAFFQICNQELDHSDYAKPQNSSKYLLLNYFVSTVLGGNSRVFNLHHGGSPPGFWQSTDSFQELLNDRFSTSPIKDNKMILEIASRLRSQTMVAFRFAPKRIILGVGPSSIEVGDLFFPPCQQGSVQRGTSFPSCCPYIFAGYYGYMIRGTVMSSEEQGKYKFENTQGRERGYVVDQTPEEPAFEVLGWSFCAPLYVNIESMQKRVAYPFEYWSQTSNPKPVRILLR